jgi:hypothetical protein
MTNPIVWHSVTRGVRGAASYYYPLGLYISIYKLFRVSPEILYLPLFPSADCKVDVCSSEK